MDVVAHELVAALQEIEFHDEAEAGDGAAHAGDELGNSGGGSTGREDVVDDENTLALFDGIFMNFKGIGTVLESVLDAFDRGGELLRLAHRNEAGPDSVGESGSEEKSACFDTDDLIDIGSGIAGFQGVEDTAKSLRILEEGGDVVEIDPGLGEVEDLADHGFELVHLWRAGSDDFSIASEIPRC